ncbi:MAG TPA: glycosyltransferase, partial [Tepidisphaeraceae bacterium]|nr:glycosyltransferase [Tepidisphaeraceae bacterium]
MVGPAWGKLSRHPDLRAALSQLTMSVDVVHVHALYEEIQVQACRAALRLQRPLVITPHGLLDRYNMRANGLAKRLYLWARLRRALNRASMIHVATEFERRNVERLGLGAPCRVEPFGLDLSEFEQLPSRGQFRRRYAALDDRPFVLYLGRIQKGKGLEILVPAMAQVIASARVAPMLVIAGPDEGYRATVERLIDTHELREHVLFTGMLHGRERIEALVDSELLAAPSLHENFSLSVAEALAAGRAVVVSDQVGLSDFVTAHLLGGVGRVDVDDIATHIAKVLDSPDRQHMGERARQQ